MKTAMPEANITEEGFRSRSYYSSDGLRDEREGSSNHQTWSRCMPVRGIMLAPHKHKVERLRLLSRICEGVDNLGLAERARKDYTDGQNNSGYKYLPKRSRSSSAT